MKREVFRRSQNATTLKLIAIASCIDAIVSTAVAFEGKIEVAITQGSETSPLLYTVGTNFLRIEVTRTNWPHPIDIVDLKSGAMTLLFPHNRSFVRLKPAGEKPSPSPGAPTMPAAPPGVGPPQSQPDLAAAGPSTPPGAPPLPTPTAGLPAGIGPRSSPVAGAPGMPSMPMMPPPMNEKIARLTGVPTNTGRLPYALRLDFTGEIAKNPTFQHICDESFLGNIPFQL